MFHFVWIYKEPQLLPRENSVGDVFDPAMPTPPPVDPAMITNEIKKEGWLMVAALLGLMSLVALVFWGIVFGMYLFGGYIRSL
ncbi:MAG: hypothetical protein HYS59_00975 [Candidatus Vogelbacteria bacterium]|nr:hypothetical protein [Candidatus Vogelbacteria bacterium]